ncbi:MAG: DUF3089 domain-containing protein [Cellvibrionaceae bacterium]
MNFFSLMLQNPNLTRILPSTLLLGFFSALTFSSSSLAESEVVDYSKDQSWLCRSSAGSLGACDRNMTTTIVSANGSLAEEKWSENPKAPIDCFYVYPTVSLDKTGNSDMLAGPEEYSVIRQQFARFGSKCRTFAPLYRQITLTALRAGLGGGEAVAMDRGLGVNDVKAAWDYYLKNYNDGRGVVLVGHSQGSGVLTSLIKDEIEGKPIQEKIISAMLIGTNIQVPDGKKVGGTFKYMPLCTSGDQTQCIVTYASFRSTVKPPKNSLFGRSGKGTQSACTNPAQLANGTNELHAYLNTQEGVSTSSVAPLKWTKTQEKLETPFASVPGLLSAECVSHDGFSYLEMTVNADPSDPRADDISGDVIANGIVNAGWGLHLVDMNIAMGNLLTITEKQTAAHLNASNKR